VKLAKTKAEEGKVAVRNIRRKAKESIETSVKDGDLGEDEGERQQKDLDSLTKKTSDQIDELLDSKQKEILEV
ncbi:ribosome-recycling factor, partial [Bifidobacterium psychraerophilum]|jgi:ribosome recycling factor